MPTLPTNAGGVGIFISDSRVLWMYSEYRVQLAKLEAYKKTVALQMESAVRNAVLKKDNEIRNPEGTYVMAE